MKAYVFPGQGSQFVGMGEDLFTRYRQWTTKADEILGYSIADLCLRDQESLLGNTRYTQPALYVVNALSFMSRCDAGAALPDCVAGHSVGEYNALLAAGGLDFETGLHLVKKRGELMSEISGGAMAAVIGCDSKTVAEIIERNELRSLDVANYNSLSQIVLSGPSQEILNAEPYFVERYARFVPLNVSAAFHSRYMQPCVASFAQELAGAVFSSLRIPVIANITARPYESANVREYLTRQLVSPVRWSESVLYLLELGVDHFEEVGPGNVLTKLIKAIREQAPAPRSKAAYARHGGDSTGLPELGSEAFRRDYRVRAAYVAGSMWGGISSRDLVVRMGRAGFLASFGAGGLTLSEVEDSIRFIQRSLTRHESFSVNWLSTIDHPQAEMALADLCVRCDVRLIEATGFIAPSAALIRYRLSGLQTGQDGALRSSRKVLAKVSRVEAALAFLQPAPPRLVVALREAGLISPEQAALADRLPMADDICVEADSAWRTSMGVSAVLTPAIVRLRDEICRQYKYAINVRVGSSGGLGTPEALAAAFILGAEFVLTGSVNQCSVEAHVTEEIKDLLQAADVHDTQYAPDSELFELGAKVQVLKKGGRFPMRANRLYDLWRNVGSWEQIDALERERIERESFGCSFERAYESARVGGLEPDSKQKLALVLRWYLNRAFQLAQSGESQQCSNYQIYCGPALGGFNRWVKGTDLETWRHRHVDVIAERLMAGAADVYSRLLTRLRAQDASVPEESR